MGLYGFVATFQTDPHFGRVLAAYGGVFVAGSLAWGMLVDGFRPDRYDLIGAAVCLAGVAVIIYAPRLMSGTSHEPAGTAGKEVVRRLIDEVMNQRRLDVLDEIYDARLVDAARRWIEPFLCSFTDVEMRIVELIAEGDRVVGRFTCSGTHTAEWLGHSPTGKRFRNVPEVYFLSILDGRITAAWGLEDTLAATVAVKAKPPPGVACRPALTTTAGPGAPSTEARNHEIRQPPTGARPRP